MAEDSETDDRFLKDLLQKCRKQSESDGPDQLGEITEMLCDDLPECIWIRKMSDYEDLLVVVERITEPGMLKDFPEKEDRDYDSTDFVGVADSAEKSFICLKHLIDKLRIERRESKELHNVLIPMLKLCGTHCKEFLWSSAVVVCLSEGILLQILRLTRSSNLQTLFCENVGLGHVTLFKAILLSIRPGLTKERWTQNPSMCQIFKWLLFYVKHPYLSNYLSDVLPPSLIFVDHHATKSKVLGIECLDFLIDNIPPTELKMYGRADVIYDALFHLVYLREADIVRILYPCILKLLSGQERSHSLPRQGQLRQWDHCNAVYHQFLWNMELEDNIIARREFSAHVGLFIEHLGITIIKHLKRTKKVLLGFLAICEGPEEISRINSLKALTVLIRFAWPRIEQHCDDIIKSILFLVYDIESGSATSDLEVQQNLLNCCKDCISCLKIACPEKVTLLVSSLDCVPEAIPGIHFIRNACKGSS